MDTTIIALLAFIAGTIVGVALTSVIFLVAAIRFARNSRRDASDTIIMQDLNKEEK